MSAWRICGCVQQRPIANLFRTPKTRGMNWFIWALLSAFFAGRTPVDKLSIVIANALAPIFLHERLTWHHWVGGLLIFTGCNGAGLRQTEIWLDRYSCARSELGDVARLDCFLARSHQFWDPGKVFEFFFAQAH